jgi:hypothetical protein
MRAAAFVRLFELEYPFFGKNPAANDFVQD